MWKFNPILKTTIWGGDRIAPYKGIDTSLSGVGESWELSGVEGDESIVAAGPDAGLTLPQLIDRHGAALMGRRNYAKFGNRFPLLIKFIDARDDLSVQVHPDDAMAQRYNMPMGKTEMWFVLDAAPGAKLANGFREPVNPDDYENLLATGEIEKCLNFVEIKEGDTYFIPAGRVHAIGSGAFVAEIQQTSDATYRIYDYHRKDKNGNERQLHTELAKEAIDFNDTNGAPVEYSAMTNVPTKLADCPYFTTNLLIIDHEVMRDYHENDSFVALIVTEGEVEIADGTETCRAHRGETILLAASTEGATITPLSANATILETYL